MKIPENVVTPYNAQATLHFYDAFWALYLPVTVAGRVSDIWRSYFTQSILPSLGLSIGFLPRPLVIQNRNPHSYIGDFKAEIPLYLKSFQLAKFVTNSSETHIDQYNNLPQAIESLWIDFYMRGYIELEDVTNIQSWLQVLLDIGYKFPNLKGKKTGFQETSSIQSNKNMFIEDSIIKTSYQLGAVRR